MRAHIVIQSVPKEKAAGTVSAYRYYLTRRKENEADISAKEKTASEGTRIPQKNVYQERQKCTQEKKRQGQKETVSIVCTKDTY